MEIIQDLYTSPLLYISDILLFHTSLALALVVRYCAFIEIVNISFIEIVTNLSSCCLIHSRNFTIGAQAILGLPEQARSAISSPKMTIFVLQKVKSALLITLCCSSASRRPASSKVSHYLCSQERFSTRYPASH